MKQVSRAPELITTQWFNSDSPNSLEANLGKVVLVEVFQMLCPGCVSHGLPQAQQVHNMFPKSEVVVLGLHSVFEHHDAMTPTSLEAFLHEYRVTFPVGVDAPSKAHDLPQTMMTYGMRGTPTLLLISREGALAGHHFGQVPDLRLGAEIAALMQGETVPRKDDQIDSNIRPDSVVDNTCTDAGCTVKDF